VRHRVVDVEESNESFQEDDRDEEKFLYP